MAHDNEYRLLSKIILDRDIIPVLERGIKSDWVVDDDLRRVWKFVVDHYAKYAEVPTLTTVKDNYPSFNALAVEDTIEYLIDQMIAFRRKTMTMQGASVVVSQLQQNDYESALHEMQKTVSVVNEQGEVGTTHVDLTKDPKQRLKDYEAMGRNELLGIATGFKNIDLATAGLQGGQLITVIAPPKTGKSQIALQVAINTHKAGHVPMFQSFEMNNQEQTHRHDAMRARVSHARLRRGDLNQLEEIRYRNMLEDMAELHPFHLVDAIGGLTVDSLVAKIDQLKPDIVFVDGVYLMFDQVTGEANTPQALTNITRGLKRVAQQKNLPVVITTQTLLWKMRGGKVTADSIGYSSSFFQDSDVILGLEPVDGEEELRNLSVVQSRNASPTNNSITWKWETGCFHDEEIQPPCKHCGPRVI
jgi:replicative DNA helicase